MGLYRWPLNLKDQPKTLETVENPKGNPELVNPLQSTVVTDDKSFQALKQDHKVC